jgi:hypothetical protein
VSPARWDCEIEPGPPLGPGPQTESWIQNQIEMTLPDRENPLRQFFDRNSGGILHKWHHYFDIYHRHFERFRGSDVHVVETGVSQGGSLRMWRDYFGPTATIHGVDVNPHCREFAAEGFTIHVGDQVDRGFLRRLRQQIPRIDILIDDGGHTMRQQIHTFEELFPHISPHGVYLYEDLHTSYWRAFGGGARRRGTFVEFSKSMIDWLNAWHSRQPRRLAVTDFTRTVDSLHFYDSILVIEKGPHPQPTHSQTGRPVIPIPRPPRDSFWRRLRRTWRP